MPYQDSRILTAL